MSEPLTAVGGAAAPAAATAGPASATGAVREPSADDKKRGEAFERMLVGQLTKTLVDSALPEDEASSAAVSAYKDMLPDALTEALMSGGGIGLAKQLTEARR